MELQGGGSRTSCCIFGRNLLKILRGGHGQFEIAEYSPDVFEYIHLCPHVIYTKIRRFTGHFKSQ